MQSPFVVQEAYVLYLHAIPWGFFFNRRIY